MDAALAPAIARRLLADAEPLLRAAGIDSARLDAEVLLAWAMGVGRTALYTRLNEPVPELAEHRFSVAVQRRRRREPVAYITGTQEFWSLPFAVSPSVLIPRPETELLIDIVKRFPLPHGKGEGEGIQRSPSILDVGTGSGCIAVALARELPHIRITAVEVSSDALSVARANADAQGVADRIAFFESDLFDALPPAARFDVIVSNPPYLAPGDACSPELAFEPRPALAAGADGLAIVRRLLAGASTRLRPGGWLVIEIGRGQADPVLRLARDAGLVQSRVEPDLAGIPRALVARWNGERLPLP